MIAITGASGFLGSFLADKLPFPQRRLTRRTSNQSNDPLWIQGDLNSVENIKHLIKDASTLIHLACSSNPRSSNQNMIQDIHQNLISAISLFEIFSRTNPEGHIILASSGGNMYEGTYDAQPHTEEDLPAPRSSYSIHKLAEEHYLRLICELTGIRATILRISNPYGTFLSSSRPQGLIGVALSKILKDETLDIIEPLETIRDYIHLDDLLQAFKITIKQPPSIGECRLFNVGSGKGHSIAEVIALLEKATQRSLKHRIVPNSSHPTKSVLSFNKINSVYDWTPTISLDEGIKRMLIV